MKSKYLWIGLGGIVVIGAGYWYFTRTVPSGTLPNTSTDKADNEVPWWASFIVGTSKTVSSIAETWFDKIAGDDSGEEVDNEIDGSGSAYSGSN